MLVWPYLHGILALIFPGRNRANLDKALQAQSLLVSHSFWMDLPLKKKTKQNNTAFTQHNSTIICDLSDEVIFWKENYIPKDHSWFMFLLKTSMLMKWELLTLLSVVWLECYHMHIHFNCKVVTEMKYSVWTNLNVFILVVKNSKVNSHFLLKDFYLLLENFIQHIMCLTKPPFYSPLQILQMQWHL